MLPGSDFSQMKRLAALQEHFRLHQAIAARSGQQVSIAEFLADHFWGSSNHHHGDNGQSHQDLPLKTVHIFSQAPASEISYYLSAPAAAVSLLIPHHCAFTGIIPAGAVFRPPMSS